MPDRRWTQLYSLWSCALVLLIPAGAHLGKNSFGPLETQICKALSVDSAGFGVILASVSLPSAIFPIFAGVIYDRFSAPRVLITAALLVLVGQACLLSSYELRDFDLALFAAGAFGAGAGSTISLQHATIALMLGESFVGFGMGLAVGAANGWRLLANMILPSLLLRYGFAGSVGSVILICAVALLASVLLAFQHVLRRRSVAKLPDSCMERQVSWESDINETLPLQILPMRQASWNPSGRPYEVWVLWLIHTFLVASTTAFSNIAPAYAVQQGLGEMAANTLIARSLRPGSLIGSLFGGVAADCIGRGEAATVAAIALAASFALLAIPVTWPLIPVYVPLFVLGLCQGALSTMVLAWLPQVIAASTASGCASSPSLGVGAAPGVGYAFMESLAAMGEVVGNISVGAARVHWGLVNGAMPLLLIVVLSCLFLIIVLARQMRYMGMMSPARQRYLGRILLEA